MSNETKCTACDGSGLHPNEVPGVGTEWVGCPDCPDKCEWCGQSDDKHENGCRFGLGPDEPDAFDSLPIAALLHARLASWFGDDRQSYLVADLVPVVTQIVAEFQHNTLEMARKADLAERRAEESEFHVEQLRDARDSAERRIERADALLDGWEHDGPDDPAILLLIQRVREVLVGSRGEVGTGAGEGATGQDTGTAWVTRSEDCPEAPAQAHLSAADDSDAALCPCGEPIGHAHHCGSCCGCGAADQHEHMAMVEHLRRCPICDMRFDKECAACGCGLDGYGNCPCGCYGWDRCDHDWLDRPESDSRECLICGVEVFG